MNKLCSDEVFRLPAMQSFYTKGAKAASENNVFIIKMEKKSQCNFMSTTKHAVISATATKRKIRKTQACDSDNNSENKEVEAGSLLPRGPSSMLSNKGRDQFKCSTRPTNKIRAPH